MPKFKVGDLILDKTLPEAGFPISDDRPMIITKVSAIGDRSHEILYYVILPGGIISTRFESEVVALVCLYPDDGAKSAAGENFSQD